MNPIHALRKLFGIRRRRHLPPAGPKPPPGSNLARNGLHLRLKTPIDDEQWDWLCMMGWRRVDMRSDRRNYETLSSKAGRALLDKARREATHASIVAWEQTRDTKGGYRAPS
jgi:hypothetical protein